MDSLPLLPGCKIFDCRMLIARKLVRFVLASETPQTCPTIFPRNARLWGLPASQSGYRGLPPPGFARSLKRVQNPLETVANIGQTAAVRQSYRLRFLPGQRLPRTAQAFRLHDRLQILYRFLKPVVHQNVVIPVIILNFAARREQAPLDHLFAIFTALAQ